MINDFFPYDNTSLRKDIVKSSYISTKNDFTENIPYRIYPSSISRDSKVVIFRNHFIETLREILSSGDGAPILKMSKPEREVWHAYVEYQDGTFPVDPEMLLVVVELNNCIANEIECKTEDYLNRAFSTEHTWEDITVGSSLSEVLSQAAYDEKLANLEIFDQVTYIIDLNGTRVAIYFGTTLMWSQA